MNIENKQKQDIEARKVRKEMIAKRKKCPNGNTCGFCVKTGLCIDNTKILNPRQNIIIQSDKIAVVSNPGNRRED